MRYGYELAGMAGMVPENEGGPYVDRPYSGSPRMDIEFARLADRAGEAVDHAREAYERGRAHPMPNSARVLHDYTGVHREQAQAQSDHEVPSSVGIKNVSGPSYPHDEVAGVGPGDPPRADNDNRSYPDGNPKTLMGAKKPDLSVVPPIALLHLATAMMNGAEKYGPFNWRDKAISYRPYLAAAMRHLASCLDGEDYSADTVEAGAPVHHLAHVMACCAIVLDAESVGKLNDNRPTIAGRTGEAIEGYVVDKSILAPTA